MSVNKDLIRGSIILLVIFNSYALLNFIFQSSMARMLSPADYGLLAFLFYFVYFSNIFSESLQTIIARYSSSEKDNGKLKNIFKRGIKKSFYYSLFLFIVYILFSFLFSYLTGYSKYLFMLNGLIIFTAFLLPIPRGIMQGRKRFYSLGLSLIVESAIKLILAISFVLLGWKVYGAIGALIIGWTIALLFSFVLLKDILLVKEKKVALKGFYNYSFPVFLVTSSILVFYTIDLFIAQIVFPKEIAGYYSIASVLSKTIFWGTQPISKAMFPISVEENINSKRNNSSMYFTSLGLLSLLIFLALTFFYFFPDLIVRIFAGRYISESSNILFFLCLATSLLSITNLNILYAASRGNLKNSKMFAVFLVIGILLLFEFSKSPLQFSLAFLTASSAFLWGSIFFLNKN